MLLSYLVVVVVAVVVCILIYIRKPLVFIPVVLCVLEPKIMKVIIIFRGLLTERILVKGFAEPTSMENGQVDIWTESQVSLTISLRVGTLIYLGLKSAANLST